MKNLLKSLGTISTNQIAFSLLIFLLIQGIFNLPIIAASGDLDLTFGTDGTAQIDLGSRLNDSAYAVAVQQDGKVIAVGVSSTASTGQDFSVIRLNQNGILDTTFNNTGRLTFNFNNNNTGVDIARAVTIQGDGRIIVVGESVTSTGNTDITLARLNSDGTFDASFGTGGKVITNLNGRNDFGKAVVLQSDGKVLVGGYSNRTTTGDDFVVVRYNTNGTLDTTFNGSGIIITDVLTNREDRASSLVLQPDGKIVASGYTNDVSFGNNFAVVRYNTDGSLDSSFNGIGKATTDLNVGSNDTGNAAAIQGDGKIVVVGQTTSDFGLVRYNSNGSIDTGFGGGDGIVTTNFETDATDVGRGVIVQNTGKIIVAGKTRTNLALARYNSDGMLDNSFDIDGLLIENTGNNINSGFGGYYGISLQTDGNIIAVGEGWRDGFGNDFAVSKLNSNGIFDLSFGVGDGISKTDFNKMYDVASSVALQQNGKIVVAGYTQVASLAYDFLIVRYNTDGTLDTSFGGDGIVTTDINGHNDDYGIAVAIQSDGKILVTGETNDTEDGNIHNLILIRYNPDGTLDSTFGINGIVIINRTSAGLGFFHLTGRSIALQPDGKIVIAGQSAYFSITDNGFVARFNSNGSLNFIAEINFNTSDDLTSVAIQSDGKIVVAGSAFNGTNNQNADFVLARFNSSGALDTSFDGDGKVFTNFDGGLADRASDIVIQPDGKIVAVGYTTSGTNDDFAAARYNIDGSLDSAFGGGDGIVNVNFNSRNDYCTAVALQADGGIILGGYGQVAAGTSNYFVAKLNANGTLNQSFGGGDGRVGTILSDATATVIGADMTLQPDGKIVIAGHTNFNSTSNDFLVVRYENYNLRSQFDFDGDGKADISVFRPDNGSWYLLNSQAGFSGLAFGLGTDKLAPADYDGDGKTDVAVVRNGNWYLQRSSAGFTGIAFGDGNDVPVPADYDGDGKADIAVFRPSNGTWYLLQSTAGFTGIAFGLGTDKPVPADYDGDGKADIAVNRNGNWYIQRSQLGFTGVLFGDSNDKLVPADYDGDGKADIAVFRPSNGTWYLLQSTAGFTGLAFGLGTDIPVAADYDGDGKADVAVVRNGNWYLNRSTQGFTGIQFGTSTDKPIPNAFVR